MGKVSIFTHYFENLRWILSDHGLSYLAVVLTTLQRVLWQMQSSVGSCSPMNSSSSSGFVFPILDYDDYKQFLLGDDPYAPGYVPVPPSPDYKPAPTFPTSPAITPIQNHLPSFLDRDQARYGLYPIEVLEGSNPLEFVVFYPYPWDPSPPEYIDEWSMMIEPCHFLDHITWFAGEWHLVWGTYTGPVYRSIW